MRIYLCFITLAFFISFNANSQNSNFKYCNEIVTANQDYSVKTTFNLSPSELQNNLEQIKSNLYAKNSIYYVSTNSKKTKLFIYHLSEVHFEDIKLLIEDLNITNLNFESTVNVEFKSSYNQIKPLNVDK